MAEICNKYEHEKDDMFLEDVEENGTFIDNFETLDTDMIVSLLW